ncbi:MAG: ATP-dependent 6-phosphofructokinase [Clostridia bacterium]
MKKIAVLTSGGDAPGMNACIRAVVRCAIVKGYSVYGVMRGYEGLVTEQIIELNNRSVGNILHTGGTILKTSRCTDFMTEEGFKKAILTLKKYKIDCLVVLGGDGTIRGAQSLKNAGINVICIPATIDNDLYYTDYTIGFDTAVTTIVSLINNVRDTSISHDRTSVIEVMGASCGDIALRSGVASGAEVIVVPEMPFTIDGVASAINNSIKKGKLSSIVIVNEKVISAPVLAAELASRGIESRPLVIGHIQRGGSPSNFDRILASRFGDAAIKLIDKQEFGIVVGILNGKIINVDIENAFKKVRKFDTELYNLAQTLSL